MTAAVLEYPPVALVLCGKSPLLAQNFIKEINGEDYEVIHACHTLDTAIAEIPSLLLSRPVCPSSTLPTLTYSISRPPISKAPRVPKAIVIGKGFSEQEIEDLMLQVRKAVPADVESRVVWLTPDDGKFSAGMKLKAVVSAGSKLPGIIADRVKDCLREGGVVRGKEGDVEGGVWGF